MDVEVITRAGKGRKLSSADYDTNVNNLKAAVEGVPEEFAGYSATWHGGRPSEAERSLTEIVRETVTSRRFGMAADGVADDTVRVKNAVANIEEHGVLRFTPGLYRVSEQIPIQRSNLKIVFDPGAELLSDIANFFQFNILGAEPTAFFNLAANALRGARSVDVADASTVNSGDYVELRSDALLPDVPNSQADKRAEMHRVAGKIGNTIHLNGTLLYDYNTANGARIGVATVREGITIEGARGRAASGAIGSNVLRGVRGDYMADVAIRGFRFQDNRPLEGTDIIDASGIKIARCRDVVIEDCILENLAYYGVGLVNHCRNVVIRNVRGSRCRHLTSIVWAGGWGEACNVLIDHCISDYSTLSGFDTHDTGREITYRDCTSRYAGDDGFQSRTGFTTYERCKAVGAFLDGFAADLGAIRVKHLDCEAIDCNRVGINNQNPDAFIRGGRFHNNGLTAPTGSGIGVYGGVIDGAEITENPKAIHWGNTGNLPLGALDIRNVKAPKSAKQVDFLRLYSQPAGGAGTFENATVRDCDIPGYGNNLWTWVANAARTDFPFARGNFTTDRAAGNLMKGTATLVGGSATVATTAIRNYAGAAGTVSRCPIRSRVKLSKVSDGGNGALYVDTITDGASFVIKSTDAADTSQVFWEIDN